MSDPDLTSELDATEMPRSVPVSPNTASAAASALRGAAEIYRRHGDEGQADGCEELARRLLRHVPSQGRQP